MDILFCAYANQDGCGKWRATIPAKYLQRRGHHATLLTEGSRRPDVMVFGRTYPFEAEVYLRMFRMCKDAGVPAIYDLDDAYALIDRHNPALHGVRRRAADVEYMLTNADLVTTTTPALAAHLRAWNPNVAVIPNSVDPEDWTPQSRPHSEIRVGWTGGSTHFIDLCVAIDGIAALKKTRPFTLVIQGLTTAGSPAEYYRAAARVQRKEFTDSPVGRAIHAFLRKTEKVKYEFHPFVPIADHPAKVCDLLLDIGIAPLADTEFNRHKSAIKFYEYAMSGAATLASNIPPYSTEPAMHADNTRKAWTERLGALMDSDLRVIAAEQREWVMANRNIEHTVELWEQALLSTWQRLAPKRAPVEAAPPLQKIVQNSPELESGSPI